MSRKLFQKRHFIAVEKGSMMTSNLELVQPNVISLEAIKKSREESQKFSSYVDYLTVLKTEELMIEVKDLIRTLGEGELGRESLVKGKLILAEISARLNMSSPMMALGVKKFQKELEAKLKEIENLFVINIQ
jgi:hypothetical protein